MKWTNLSFNKWDSNLVIETDNSPVIVEVTASKILGTVRPDTFPGTDFRFGPFSSELFILSDPSEAFG